MNTLDDTTESERRNGHNAWVDAVRRQVKSLRYGVVQIVVHDSRVVQIEKTERIRFPQVEAA